MIDNVLTIKTGFSDLLPMPEFYQVVTYSQKREELLSLIYEKKNFKPFASMKLIREINFLIKKDNYPMEIAMPCRANREAIRNFMLPDKH